MSQLELLERATSRNIEIPRIGDEVYKPPLASRLQRIKTVSKFFVKGVGRVEGSEYLATALELAQTENVVVIGNHQTDLDHVSRRIAYEAVGHRDFADRILFYAGYKMYERWYISMFMGAEHTIVGPTPADFEELDRVLNEPDNFSSEQIQILERYRENLIGAKKVAGDKMFELTKPGPNSLIYSAYPEGGRSYTGRLKDVSPEIAGSFGRAGYFLPIAMHGGAENSLRPQHIPNPLTRDWITMVIGEPYPKRQMWDWYREGTKRGEKRNPTYYPMAMLAALMPDEYIEPGMLPVYREIIPEVTS